MAVTFEKSQVEKYKFINRSCTNAWEFAYFIIDESIGSISIESDFINWTYTWPGQAGKLKEFIISCDNHYLLKNFVGHGKQLNFYFSLKSIIDQTTEYFFESYDYFFNEKDEKEFSDNSITEELSEMITKIKKINSCETAEQLYYEVSCIRTDKVNLLSDIFEGGYLLPIHKGYDSHETGFFESIWPLFIDVIKKEINKKK